MNDLDRLADLVAAAKRAGADAADALLVQNASLSVSRRLGRIEQLERAEGFDLGLRVFLGKRQAIVSSTDPDPKGFAALAERAVAMARVVPEDPFGGLPDSFDPPRDPAPFDLFDPTEPTAEQLIARAAAAEDTALAVKGITTIPERYVETAQTLGASKRQIVMKVLVPQALPDLVTGLRFLFGLAFGYIMLAEAVAAERGLGFMLIMSQRRGDVATLLYVLVVIGILAFLIDRVLRFFQRGLFPHRNDIS